MSFKLIHRVRADTTTGFVDDDKRMTVATTRAKEVFYILGGSCNGEYDPQNQFERAIHDADPDNIPAYVRYKIWLTDKRRLLEIKNTTIKEVGSDWIDKLKKKEVSFNTLGRSAHAQHVGRVEQSANAETHGTVNGAGR